MREILIEPTFVAWRDAARMLLRDDVPPERVVWSDRSNPQASLLVAESPARNGADAVQARLPLDVVTSKIVPRAFLRLAASVACHRESGRWDALYRVLWRITHGEPSLLEVATDPDVHALLMMHRAVKRETHKMHAFVRFRAIETTTGHEGTPGGETMLTYVAWFEPMHHVVERAAPLFVRRFASMRWSILTPDVCAHWDGVSLRFSAGVSQNAAPRDDALEELWRSYYANVFNPARVSLTAMQSEMPKRFWNNLPESRLISTLTREAPGRVARMLAQSMRPAQALPPELAPIVRATAARMHGGDVGVVNTGSARAPRSWGSSITPSELSTPTVSVLATLHTPSEIDPLHDPGVAVGRARADEVRLHAPEGLLLSGIPVRVGSASWTDPTTLAPGVFYPDDVNTPELRLRYYADRYSLVEVDSTYYALPSRANAVAWAARTPDWFVFDIKAFALMTGQGADTKRLPDWLRRKLPPSVASSTRIYARDLPTELVDEVWERFLSALAPLRDANKLGPILLQFPRWFTPTRANADLLTAARARLGDALAAVEFRNPEWVTGRMTARTIALLERLRLTYVVVDAPPGTASSMPPDLHVTTPGLSVVRLHGRRTEAWEAKHTVTSERYRYLYDREELAVWAERITTLAGRVRETVPPGDVFSITSSNVQGVHVVHNNCHGNYATTNAEEIAELLIEYDRERLLL